MAILKIARMGHPVLRQPAETVADPRAPEIARLVDDMIETMIDANGAGLAAPQVHVPMRVVIFLAPGVLPDEPEANALTVLINPEIEVLDGDAPDDLQDGWEGCLSVPGLRGLVPRHRAIRYSGQTLNGERLERLAEGFHARVVQHECDHLDGVLFPQRMTDLTQLIFETEMRHVQRSEPKI